jgi:hypothetical protein
MSKAAYLATSKNEFTPGTLTGPVLKLIGSRWRPRTLVLETGQDGNAGNLWWYSEAEGPERMKGCIPLHMISGCCNSALSGEEVKGKDGKAIQGFRKDVEGAPPMFDVTSHNGQTHTFRIYTDLVQKRLTSTLDNKQLDKAIMMEQGAWISAIKNSAGIAARLAREMRANGAFALGMGRDKGMPGAEDGERSGQGLEHHFVPALGLFFRQQSAQRLASRAEHRRRLAEGADLGATKPLTAATETEQGHSYTRAKAITTLVAGFQQGGPAERSNLEIDDQVVQVNDTAIDYLQWPAVAALLDGEAGTQVVLLIRRKSAGGVSGGAGIQSDQGVSFTRTTRPGREDVLNQADQAPGLQHELRVQLVRQSEFARLRAATVDARLFPPTLYPLPSTL